MRRADPAMFPTLLCAAILTAAAAGVAAGAHLQRTGSAARAAPSAKLALFTQAQAQATFRFVDDRPKLTPVPQPDVAAPAFHRIIIEKTGVSKLEGDGTPGSQVLIKSSGLMIGAAIVDASGRWAVSLGKKLDAGDYNITLVAAGRETMQDGDEVRVFIPADFADREIVVYDRARVASRMPARPDSDETGSVSRRAQDLADAASRRFTEIVPPAAVQPSSTGPVPRPPARRGIDVATPVAGWLERASQAYQVEVARNLTRPVDATAPSAAASFDMAQTTEPAPAPEARSAPSAPDASSQDPLSSGVDAVRGWLKDASETYQRDIAEPLTVPANPNAVSESKSETVIKEPKPPVDTSGNAAEAARKIQQERERAVKALRDAEARDAADSKASTEETRQAAEAKRKEADERAAKARDAARAAAVQARKDAEAKRIEDVLKRLENAQKREREAELKKAEMQAKPAPADGPLPSDQELSRDRSFAASQSDPNGRRLQFTVEGDDEGDEDRAAAPERSNRQVKTADRSSANGARAGGWRSRNEADARHARSCHAGTTRRNGRKQMIYVVQPGDTLWAIANRHYRHGSRYTIIYRANQHRIPDADVIRPCQKLVLPLRGKRRV